MSLGRSLGPYVQGLRDQSIGQLTQRAHQKIRPYMKRSFSSAAYRPDLAKKVLILLPLRPCRLDGFWLGRYFTTEQRRLNESLNRPSFRHHPPRCFTRFVNQRRSSVDPEVDTLMQGSG